MSNVVHLHGDAAPEPVRDPHTAFAHARKAMLAAFREWVRTNPDPSDVAAEVDGTAQIMKSTYRLETDDGA